MARTIMLPTSINLLTARVIAVKRQVILLSYVGENRRMKGEGVVNCVG